MTEKHWLKFYPEGVPSDVDYMQYTSLVHFFDEIFDRYAKRDAFVCMGAKITYAQLDVLSTKLAAWLQHQGLKKGARVAVMMPNTLPYPIAVIAILRAGYTVVNVNPLYTGRELLHQLNDSGAQAIIILENVAHVLDKIVAQTSIEHIIVTSLGDMLGSIKGVLTNFVVRHIKKIVPVFSLPNAHNFSDVMRQANTLTLSAVDIHYNDIAFLQYTGGTTGVSKGAMLSHRNLIANVLQNEAWLNPALNKPPHVDQLTMMCALPLYHIFALTICALLGMRLGSMIVLIPNPRDFAGFVKTLSKYRVNIFPGVNTLFQALLEVPAFKKLDFSALKISNGGGVSVQKNVAQQWLEVTGCPIIEGYGLSETSPVVTANPINERTFSGTVGLPVPSTEVVLLDDHNQRVQLGVEGEIAVRGPQVMLGYWGRVDETAQCMTADGFLKTGDIGVMQADGRIRILDRKKDMILVSGFKVYPGEVEQVVNLHPLVLESACIGVPDAHSGEAVKIFVVRRDSSLTKEILYAFCKESLTGYKRPRYIEFCESLPKTNVGKILRRQLKDHPA